MQDEEAEENMRVEGDKERGEGRERARSGGEGWK